MKGTHIVILVKDPEGLHKLLLCVSFTNFGCHHVLKFIVINCSTTILVYICNHLVDLLK